MSGQAAVTSLCTTSTKKRQGHHCSGCQASALHRYQRACLQSYHACRSQCVPCSSSWASARTAHQARHGAMTPPHHQADSDPCCRHVATPRECLHVKSRTPRHHGLVCQSCGRVTTDWHSHARQPCVHGLGLHNAPAVRSTQSRLRMRARRLKEATKRTQAMSMKVVRSCSSGTA